MAAKKTLDLNGGKLGDLYKEANASGTEQMINVDSIDPNPYQPRQTIDQKSIDSLAESLKSDAGQLQPIVVRPNPNDSERFILVAGQRRLLATKKNKQKQIKATTVDISEELAALASLIENDQREDLTPIDRANHYQFLMEKFDWSQRQLSAKLNVSQTIISDCIGLLSLPDFLQEAMDNNVVTSPRAAAELRKAHSIDPERVEKMVAGADSISKQEATETYQQLKSKQEGDSKTSTTGPAPGGGLDRQPNDKSDMDDPDGKKGSQPTSKGLLPVDMLVNDAFGAAETNKPIPGSQVRLKEILIDAIGRKRDPSITADAIIWALKSDQPVDDGK